MAPMRAEASLFTGRSPCSDHQRHHRQEQDHGHGTHQDQRPGVPGQPSRPGFGCRWRRPTCRPWRKHPRSRPPTNWWPPLPGPLMVTWRPMGAHLLQPHVTWGSWPHGGPWHSRCHSPRDAERWSTWPRPSHSSKLFARQAASRHPEADPCSMSTWGWPSIISTLSMSTWASTVSRRPVRTPPPSPHGSARYRLAAGDQEDQPASQGHAHDPAAIASEDMAHFCLCQHALTLRR